jgi:hypothetical protein
VNTSAMTRLAVQIEPPRAGSVEILTFVATGLDAGTVGSVGLVVVVIGRAWATDRSWA